MAQKPEFDWYAAEWLEGLGISQADLTRKLGWSKAKASDVISGKQRYTRDLVNELAKLLQIVPYELLMHPSQAAAFRGLRERAAEIVKSDADQAHSAAQEIKRRA